MKTVETTFEGELSDNLSSKVYNLIKVIALEIISKHSIMLLCLVYHLCRDLTTGTELKNNYAKQLKVTQKNQVAWWFLTIMLDLKVTNSTDQRAMESQVKFVVTSTPAP